MGKLSNYLKEYIAFLPKYLFSTFIALIIDILIFTVLKPGLGTNFSAVIAFLFSQSTLYFILFSKNVSLIKKKRYEIFYNFWLD